MWTLDRQKQISIRVNGITEEEEKMKKKLEEILVPRVAKEKWPIPIKTRELLKCGSVGRLVENIYIGQKFPWGLFEQTGHAVSAIIIVEAPAKDKCLGRYVALVNQWRPTDITALEFPAGNTGVDPMNIVKGVLSEINQEVGAIKIRSVFTCKGFSHNTVREVVAGGGPKCIFPFLIFAESTTPPKVYTESGTDEKTFCRWYEEDQIQEMVKENKITDIVTIFFLMAASIISIQHLEWTNISKEVIGDE